MTSRAKQPPAVPRPSEPRANLTIPHRNWSIHPLKRNLESIYTRRPLDVITWCGEQCARLVGSESLQERREDCGGTNKSHHCCRRHFAKFRSTESCSIAIASHQGPDPVFPAQMGGVVADRSYVQRLSLMVTLAGSDIISFVSWPNAPPTTSPKIMTRGSSRHGSPVHFGSDMVILFPMGVFWSAVFRRHRAVKPQWR